ncbi:MAG: hypothetical protein ACI8W8_004842 [Rhodothermales bacterium]|jgi:hypothetical protein
MDFRQATRENRGIFLLPAQQPKIESRQTGNANMDIHALVSEAKAEAASACIHIARTESFDVALLYDVAQALLKHGCDPVVWKPSAGAPSLAGTPRRIDEMNRLLSNPSVTVVYTTVGLDPSGCVAVHEHALRSGASRCVHVSFGAINGRGQALPRICPPGVICCSWNMPNYWLKLI